MAINTANIQPQFDTFAGWITKTNIIAYDMSTIVVTTDTTTNGAITTGNAYVNGIFSANTFTVLNDIRGGNGSTPATLTISSNVAMSNALGISIGNSSINTTISSSNLNTTSVFANTASIISTLTVGSNVGLTTTTVFVGNSTTNSFINSTAFSSNSFIANSALTVGSNVGLTTTTVFVGNSTTNTIINSTSVTTNAVVANASVSVGANVGLTPSTIFVGNATINTIVNATSFSGTANNTTNFAGLSSSTWAGYITGNAASAYSNAVTNAAFMAGQAYSNAVANAAAIYQTTAGLAANVLTLASNSTTYHGNSSGTLANVASWITGNAASAAATAYSNAIAIAANASNITNGTIPTARLPATINATAQLNVGGNVNINTTGISISTGGSITLIDPSNVSNFTTISAGGLTLPAGSNSAVTSFNGRAGIVVLTSSDIVGNTTVGLNYTPLSANSSGTINGSLTLTGSDLLARSVVANGQCIVGNTTTNTTITATLFSLGNSTANVTINSTAFSGTSNNSLNLGGSSLSTIQSQITGNSATAYSNATSYADTKSSAAYSNAVANAAALYQTTAGLSANVLTLSANMATYHGNSSGTLANVASWISGNAASAYANAVANSAAIYQTTAGLSANVATLTANNSTNLNGQPASYYTNATNISTGKLPVAQINTTAQYTYTNTFTVNAVLITANSTGTVGYFGANGNVGVGTSSPAYTLDVAGNLHSTGIAQFDSNLTVSGSLVVSGNLTIAGSTTYVNTSVISTSDKAIYLSANSISAAISDGSGIVATSASSLLFNNATTSWQSNVAITPLANNALNLGGPSNYWANVYANQIYGTLVTTSQPNITANNSTNFNSQPASYYTNATNISTGTVPTARLGSGTANSTTIHVGNSSWATIPTVLGYTPYNATNPSGYITSSALSPYALLSGATFTGDITSYRSGSPTTGLIYLGNNSGNTYLWYDGANFRLNGGPLLVASSITATGDVTAFSDSRLKTDLQKIENALDKVDQLTGYTFNRNDTDSNKRSTGLIAQDVQKVLPEAVIEGDEYLSLAYGNLVGLLVEAIKELKDQVEEIKAKLA